MSVAAYQGERAERRAVTAPWFRLPRLTITGWLGVVSFFVSMAAAVWIRQDLHYIIGDSLARTANAVYVVASRDPHAGAIGFYWPPLHSILQIPFVLVLRPFDAIEWAGPLTSATALAITVALLGRLARHLHVGRWTTFGVCAAFALNPVMIFYGANGMSETTFFLFLVLAFDGFIRWCRDDSTGALTTCAMALAALVLIRVEAVFVVAVFVVVGAWAGRNLRQALSGAVLLGLPAGFAFTMWIAAQQILLSDGLYFLHTNASTATEVREWLPAPSDRAAVLRWAAIWVVLFGPALAAVLPVLVVRLRPGTRWHRDAEVRAVAALLGTAAVFPALHAYLLLNNATTGNPRYFLPVTVVAAVAVLWAAAPERRRPLAQAWNLVLVAAFAGTAVVSTFALTSPVRTKVEQEHLVFETALGRDRNEQLAGVGAVWLDLRALARDVERMVPARSRVLADSTYTFPLILFSANRTSFVIPNDRDFEPILADPEGKVDFVVTADEAFLRNRFGAQYDDPVGAVVAGQPDRWEKVATHGSFTLYRSKDGLLGSPRVAAPRS
jgi:4-amino-4-deoxy-L-arabinose transferase-like glycosyltransferase